MLGTGLLTTVHRVLAYSNTNMFLTPAFRIDTEIERGYPRRNRIIPERIAQNLGCDIGDLYGGMRSGILCMAVPLQLCLNIMTLADEDRGKLTVLLNSFAVLFILSVAG